MSHLEQTLFLTQVFVHLLVKVIQSLLHLFARILFDDFAQLLFVEGQLVAHLLLAHTLSHSSLNSFKEMLRETESAFTLQLFTT